jgi:peptidoglycan/xylan/chitin deacetylase (PgdA/CDA1 family)
LECVTKLSAVALAGFALAWHGSVGPGHVDVPVPILEFHVIADPSPGAPNQGLYDAPSTFRAQISWLVAHGYHGVTLDAVFRSWRSSGWLALPQNPVVLSFDDGYPEDVDVAMPVLREKHWPAVLNLQVGNLVPGRVRRLMAAGWEIDAHTFTHPDLTSVSEVRLRREISGSRRWIQSVFGVPADFFAYPYGRYDARVVAEVSRAGYRGAETQDPGDASGVDRPYRLPRIEITRDDGVAGLVQKLDYAKTRTSR